MGAANESDDIGARTSVNYFSNNGLYNNQFRLNDPKNHKIDGLFDQNNDENDVISSENDAKCDDLDGLIE